MIENGFLLWGLTAPLLAASLYAVLRACRQAPLSVRVGFGLHAAMMAAMAAMLAPDLRWPALPQVLLFGLAAWWFILRAAARRPLPVAGPARSPLAEAALRGTLLYNALTMAAMAYMLAAMDVHGTAALAGPGAAGLPGTAAHHTEAAVGLPLRAHLPGPEQGWTGQPAFVLAFVFGLAGAGWAVLLLRRVRMPGRPHSGEAFLELTGAASMAAMFAALGAG